MQGFLYECGICNSLHPWKWSGDCRDDEHRFESAEDYAARTEGVDPDEVVVLSWEDRLAADRRENAKGGSMPPRYKRLCVCGHERSVHAYVASDYPNVRPKNCSVPNCSCKVYVQRWKPRK